MFLLVTFRLKFSIIEFVLESLTYRLRLLRAYQNRACGVLAAKHVWALSPILAMKPIVTGEMLSVGVG